MPADPIQGAQRAINDGGLTLRQVVPGCVREIVESDAWRGRTDKRGREFPDFPSFVEHEQWEGLGILYTDLIRFCSDFPDVVRLLEGAYGEVGKAGRPVKSEEDKPDSVRVSPEQGFGNAHSYTMRRLKRDAPELFDRVASGELSANAAAREAGFRRPVVQVTGTDPDKTAARLIERFGPEWCRELAAALSQEGGGR